MSKGIDWTGSVSDMQRFAEYLAGIDDGHTNTEGEHP